MSVLGLIDKYHKHPLFVLVLALSTLLYGVYSYRTYATTASVQAVSERVDGMEASIASLEADITGIATSIKRRGLEQRIHAYEAEIFDLQRRADEGTARDLDFHRLSRLKSELNTAERELLRIN